MRQSIEPPVFFGMLGVTAFGLLFTPAFTLSSATSHQESRTIGSFDQDRWIALSSKPLSTIYRTAAHNVPGRVMAIAFMLR